MKNVLQFPSRLSHSERNPFPSGTALSLIAICGGDFLIQQPKGPTTNISWADDALAKKALFVIDEMRAECGNEAHYAVELISFNSDGSAVDIILDINELLSGGGCSPFDPKIVTQYMGQPLLIDVLVHECRQ